MLKRIRIDNYKCFQNFECEFGAANVLLGENGSGKSSVFDVLALIRDICYVGDALDGRVGGDTWTRWGNENEQRFEIAVDLNGRGYEFLLRIVAADGHLRTRILEESLSCDGVPIFRFHEGRTSYLEANPKLPDALYTDWRRSALAFVSDQAGYSKTDRFKAWLGKLLVLEPNPKEMGGVADGPAEGPNRRMTNFADWYAEIHDRVPPGKLLAYFADLEPVIPGLNRISFADLGEGKRQLKVHFDGSDGVYAPTVYRYDELSDGQRLLIGLYAVRHFACEPDRTLCFDEPDNFLALREVRPWLESILEADDPPQVLLSTHHPEIIDRMAFREGLWFRRDKECTVRVRPFDDRDRTGLRASELMARGWVDE